MILFAFLLMAANLSRFRNVSQILNASRNQQQQQQQWQQQQEGAAASAAGSSATPSATAPAEPKEPAQKKQKPPPPTHKITSVPITADAPEKKHVCAACNKSLSSARNLARHMDVCKALRAKKRAAENAAGAGGHSPQKFGGGQQVPPQPPPVDYPTVQSATVAAPQPPPHGVPAYVVQQQPPPEVVQMAGHHGVPEYSGGERLFRRFGCIHKKKTLRSVPRITHDFFSTWPALHQ